MFKSYAGHVPENGRECRHHAQSDKRIGDIVTAHTLGIKVTLVDTRQELLPYLDREIANILVFDFLDSQLCFIRLELFNIFLKY